MDTPNNNTESRKHKHLSFEERMTIQIRLKDGHSAYRIAKELNRPINTVLNEIRRGTVVQKKQNQTVQIYLADAGQANYSKNRNHSKTAFKLLQCQDFITFVSGKLLKDKWSIDACVGYATLLKLYEPEERVCTKTLYSYAALGLLPFTVMDLPLVLKRSSKKSRVRKHKKNLGQSIEERPDHIETREEFGHWEIDTVIGKKTKDDNVLLTIVERQTRNSIFLKIPDKTSESVSKGILELREYFGSKFDQVFKSITADNGLEFAGLYKLETELETQVYFAHPYASYERGTNERHNGLIRRFIAKGKAISDHSAEAIAFIEDWCNTLPRKILGYRTPEELFEKQLDLIYST